MPKNLQRSPQSDAVLRAVAACFRMHTRPGQTVLAAVSGGVDSTALGLAIAAVAPGLGLRVVLGTVDHGLREGSAAEVERVATWAHERGLELLHERVQVEREGGLEAAARRARYAALGRLARKAEAEWIATAHTASDQAETVLLRLARGSGLRGARAILPKRGKILRPLLGVSRAELERFLEQRGQKALVEDPSNADLRRARNRIRHEVLPRLREAFAGADAALARFASGAREDERALLAWAKSLDAPGRKQLRKLPVAVLKRWLRAQVEALGHAPSFEELQAASKLVRGKRTASIELGRRVVIEANAARVIVRARGDDAAIPAQLLEEGTTRVEWARSRFELARGAAAFDEDLRLPSSIALPLTVRPVAPGDQMVGERGTIRLNRLLIDRKVPRSERARVPVVADANGEILWVVGHRISARLRDAGTSPDGWLLRVRPLGRT